MIHEDIGALLRDEEHRAPLIGFPDSLTWTLLPKDPKTKGPTGYPLRTKVKSPRNSSDLDWVHIIGTTGWNWKDKVSVCWILDIDAADGHDNGHADLSDIIAKASASYATVYRSKGGKGIHVLVMAPPGTTATSEAQHFATGDTVADQFCRDTGILREAICTAARNAWIYQVDAPEEAWEIIHEATTAIEIEPATEPEPKPIDTHDTSPELSQLLRVTAEMGGAVHHDLSGLWHVHLDTMNNAAKSLGMVPADLTTGNSDPASPNHWLDDFGFMAVVGTFAGKRTASIWYPIDHPDPMDVAELAGLPIPPNYVEGHYRDITDPRCTAKRFAKTNSYLCMADESYLFDGLLYAKKTESEMVRAMTRAAEEIVDEFAIETETTPKKVLRCLGSNALNTLAAHHEHARPDHKVKFRLSDPSADVRHIHRFQNGDLDIAAWIENPTTSLGPIDPDIFLPHASRFDFDPSAKCPAWDAFIDSLEFGDALPYVQQCFGYMAFPIIDLEKWFAMFGGGRNGKGVMRDSLIAIKGGPKIAGSIRIDEFASEFGLEKCVGKDLIIVNEAGKPTPKTLDQVVGRIKEVTGGDDVSVNRKNLTAIDYRFSCPILLLGNNRPNLPDTSGALSMRQLIIPFSKSFLGKEDQFLKSKLKSELPGITNWALAGIRELAANGWQFKVPASIAEATESAKRITAPGRTFLDSCFDIDPTHAVTDSLLVDLHKRNHDVTPSKTKLVEQVIGAEPVNLRSAKVKTDNATEIDGATIHKTKTETIQRPTVVIGLKPKEEQE